MNVSVEQGFEMSCHVLGTAYFVITKLPSKRLLINHVFAIVLNGLLIIPTVLLNAVAIITILNSSQLIKKPCYYIILIQSVIDLGVGIFGIPLFHVYLASGIGEVSDCIVASLALISTFLPYGASIVTLSALIMERYIAILHPYAYRAHVTKRRLLIYVGVGAVVMLSVTILGQFFNPRLLQTFGIVLEALLFVLTAFVYTRIYLVVRKLARPPNQLHEAGAVENLTRMKLFLQEMKQARSCFIVVVWFFVLWLFPGAIAFSFFESLDKYDKLAVSIWVFTLHLSNSSVNSMIFFWTKTMLRKEAIKMLKIIQVE